MANRMKGMLDKVISWNQSAFIPKRLITNNIMVAYEVLHTMQTKQKGREGSMAIKLNMSKAYDKVEWDFLEAVLLRLGFGQRWTELLMKCIKSISYSVIINGTLEETIIASRGLRQGDPLSPYLFLIFVEGLSALLHQAERRGLIKGVVVTRGEQESTISYSQMTVLSSVGQN
ncbi:secreted RxLR effector protein 78-like [Carya illinoinensis]|uniref:secreted RxLR effector protein 78-like n=1 Tax=Carya illinoinensis TaxID=32201 RepID=UPI001C718718|nr:secreted RxLR effector protein 78-like [Carya illinoinensis]